MPTYPIVHCNSAFSTLKSIRFGTSEQLILNWTSGTDAHFSQQIQFHIWAEEVLNAVTEKQVHCITTRHFTTHLM
jgi:hypothetical protein